MGREHLAENWTFLFENMTRVVTSLRDIDARTESTPRARLKPVRQTVADLAERVRRADIARLGNLNVARTLAFVRNNLNSIDSALETGDIGRSRLGTLLTENADKIEGLTQEIAVHMDHRVLGGKAEKYETKADNIAAQTPAPAAVETQRALDANVAGATNFRSFAEAMRAAVDHVEEQMDHTPTQTVTAANTSLNEVRERHLFTSIGDEFDPELQRVLAKLKTFEPSPEAPFFMVQVPLIVISDRQIPVQNLTASGIPYKVIPFPGIQHGVTPGGRSEQVNTFGVILKQQVVAAYSNRALAGAATSNPRRRPTSGGGHGLSDNLDHGLTREHLPAILKMRTGRAFVDVLAGASGKATAIMSKKLPGFRLVWLLPEDQYRRLGSLNIHEVGLPFR